MNITDWKGCVFFNTPPHGFSFMFFVSRGLECGKGSVSFVCIFKLFFLPINGWVVFEKLTAMRMRSMLTYMDHLNIAFLSCRELGAQGTWRHSTVFPQHLCRDIFADWGETLFWLVFIYSFSFRYSEAEKEQGGGWATKQLWLLCKCFGTISK